MDNAVLPSRKQILDRLLACDKNLSEIELDSQKQKQNELDPPLSELLRALKGNLAVEAVRICHVTLTDVEHSALCESLSNMPSLTRVTLRNVGLTASTARSYAQALPWSRLTNLSLAKNPKLGPRGCKALLAAASTCFVDDACALTHLDLSHVRLGHFGAEALGPILPSGLQELHLSNNEMGADGIWKLAASGRLSQLAYLVHLDVSFNQMGDDGCSQLLGSSGSENPKEHGLSSLQILDLRGNEIGLAGITHLSQQLPQLESLQQLYLQKNNLANDGAIQFAKSLSRCSGLESLYLSSNHIGDSGCVAIAEGLLPRDLQGDDSSDDSDTDNEEVETTFDVGTDHDDIPKTIILRELHLDHNEIDDEGAGAFVEHLDEIPSLQVLKLDHNAISDARQRILDMLMKHRIPVVLTPERSAVSFSNVASPDPTEAESEAGGFSEHPEDDSTLQTAAATAAAKLKASQVLASLPPSVKVATEKHFTEFLKLRTELFFETKSKDQLQKDSHVPKTIRIGFRLSASQRLMRRSNEDFKTLARKAENVTEDYYRSMKTQMIALADLETSALQKDISTEFCHAARAVASAFVAMAQDGDTKNWTRVLQVVFDEHNKTLLKYAETGLDKEEFYRTIASVEHVSIKGSTPKIPPKLKGTLTPYHQAMKGLFVETWDVFIATFGNTNDM